MNSSASPDITRTTLTVLIIGLLIVGSLWTLLPFIGALIWATAIVVATWPLLLWVQERVGGSRALATTIMVAIVAVVAEELDGLLEHVITEPERHDLYGRIVRNIRSEPVRASGGVTKADLLGALASFWLVFLASLPAAIPFMLMDDAMQALRMSNVVLLALLFFTGYRWAKYTLGHPWIVGSCFLIGGIAMVWTAIMLGG